jgi:ADP-ribosylglycohydrolase
VGLVSNDDAWPDEPEPSLYSPLGLVRHEVVQRRDEGCPIPDVLAARVDRFDDPWDPEIDAVHDALLALPDDPELARREPSSLAEIRRLRPPGPRDLSWTPDESELVARFHGAWTGRAIGCALGKPVEYAACAVGPDGSWPGRRWIEEYLVARGEWPLRDFFSSRDASDGKHLICPSSTRERIAFMPPDDDIHYSLLGLFVLEEVGPRFTWRDVARTWLERLPLTAVFTAELQALRTVIAFSERGRGGVVTPALARRHRNPYREWIGAQIRSDPFGWAAAGKPELAAALAYRDACWTHDRNGIYGAMFFAAMHAAAFVERDPHSLVQIALSEIPVDCRLARTINSSLDWIAGAPTWDACMAIVERELAGMHPVHTINNAVVCLLSLFYGAMEPNDCITISVMCGLDTDCNGATVGAIAGASAGAATADSPLAGPLHDEIRPALLGCPPLTMRELAARTARVYKRLAATAGSLVIDDSLRVG